MDVPRLDAQRPFKAPSAWISDNWKGQRVWVMSWLTFGSLLATELLIR